MKAARIKPLWDALEQALVDIELAECFPVLKETLEKACSNLGRQTDFQGPLVKNERGLNLSPNDVFRRLFVDKDTAITSRVTRMINEVFAEKKVPLKVTIDLLYKMRVDRVS